MFKNKKSKLIPRGFLWRLTLLNILVIAVAIGLSGYAMYNTACFLVEGMASLPANRQKQFNATLYQYLLIFTMLGILVSSVLHFYFTKKLIEPIKQMIQSTKQLKQGEYPEEIEVTSDDEVGQLVMHYNELIHELESTEGERERLITNLSHELRTPATNLQGYLQALRTGVIEGDKELYDSLYKEIRRLTSLIDQVDQLKDIKEMQARHMHEVTSFNSELLIEQVLKMFDLAIKNKSLKIDKEVESFEMSGKKEYFEQIIINLIDNAIRYSEPGMLISLNCKAEEAGFYFNVSNYGQTMSDEEISHLFERFYRRDAARHKDAGGTGLGLAIVKEIVESEEGKIKFTSDDGLNTVEVWLKAD